MICPVEIASDLSAFRRRGWENTAGMFSYTKAAMEQCAVSLAMGLPPEGALNMAAWDMIRDLVSAEPSLNEAAWEGLRGIVGLLSDGKDENRNGRFRRAG